MTTTRQQRTILSTIGGVIALLLIMVGIRSGVLAALSVAGIAVALIGCTAALFVVTERRRLAGIKPATQKVQHCDCCDKACLMAKVCEPGAEPLVTHE